MGYPGRFRSAGRGAGKNFIVRGRTSMEKQLPAEAGTDPDRAEKFSESES